jgi:hypothetical protein
MVDSDLREIKIYPRCSMISGYREAWGGYEMASKSDEPESPLSRVGAYQFDRLRLGLVLRDLYFTKTDPGPGDRIVDFDLPTLDGGRFCSEDFSETAPVLLVFGSYSCPVTESAASGLRSLHARYGDRVSFVMVNVREAHPGANVPQPNSMEEKRAHACLLRDLHDFPFDVAVDDIDGSLHRAMSPKPNSAYLLGNDGLILFRAHWANATRALEAALEDVTAGRPLRQPVSHGPTRPIWPTLRYIAPVLDRAGPGAWRDMWRAVPPMAAAAWFFRLFSPSGTK